MTSDLRLAPHLAARFLGAGLVLVAVLVFATTLLAALTGLAFTVVAVVAVVGVAGTGVLAWWLRRVVVLHLDDRGYRVRLVRGAGTHEAAWSDVEDAVTSYVAGAPCLVLRLRDGRSTTIPVEVLSGDREELVREVQDRLQRGHGLPPLPREGTRGDAGS